LTSPDKKNGVKYGAAGLYLAVPGILLAAPTIGFFIGNWADGKLGTQPYLMIAGLVLGFVAAAREIFNLLKKAQAMDEEKDDK
jgi:F0F1-type ATP synthase assembly protein I